MESVYYPEVVQLIKDKSGASRVVIFDHTLRSGDEAEREEKLIREPVLSAHNDYTEWSGPNRVREILPDEAEVLLARRFAIIQVWRAINQPIQANPLAIADGKSIAMEDLIVAERRYPHRVGQTYRLKYNPNHRWFYFPEMRRDEALMFKVYDSEKGRPGPVHASHIFRGPYVPSKRAVTAEHRGTGFSLFHVLDEEWGIGVPEYWVLNAPLHYSINPALQS